MPGNGLSRMKEAHNDERKENVFGISFWIKFFYLLAYQGLTLAHHSLWNPYIFFRAYILYIILYKAPSSLVLVNLFISVLSRLSEFSMKNNILSR